MTGVQTSALPISKESCFLSHIQESVEKQRLALIFFFNIFVKKINIKNIFRLLKAGCGEIPRLAKSLRILWWNASCVHACIHSFIHSPNKRVLRIKLIEMRR